MKTPTEYLMDALDRAAKAEGALGCYVGTRLSHPEMRQMLIEAIGAVDRHFAAGLAGAYQDYEDALVHLERAHENVKHARGKA